MQSDIQGLLEELNSLDEAHYRFMAEHIDGEFRVTRLIIGPQASWEKQDTYEYKDVIFVAHTARGIEVANWLYNGTITTWYNRSFPIMSINKYVNFSNHPSHSQAGSFTISKPFTMYRVAFSSAVSTYEHEFIAENAPFFFTSWEAERHLLYDVAEAAASSAWQKPEPGIYVYIEHTDAWLEKIHFSPIMLEIHIAGTSLTGAKLKVIGSGIQSYDDYPQQDVITIPLPDGRPDYLKVALIKGNTLLDYYTDYKDSRSNPFALQRTNVTFAEPEQKDRVRELIDRGEGRTIEFKAEIGLTKDNRMKWLKTIAAFANGEGGNLILGVRDEDGAIVGFDSTLAKHGSLSKLKDAITNAISDTIEPVPEYEFLDACIDGHNVLVIEVQAGITESAIYQNGGTPAYYIRRGATTRVADHNEVRELIKLKTFWVSGNSLGGFYGLS